MKEFKGTPGSWEVTTWTNANFSNVASSIYHQISSATGYFDDVSKRGFGLTGYMNHHDAQLIAAAPDLLEALQDMLSGWKYIREHHGELYGVGWDRAQDKAMAAIEKALGE